MRLSQELGDSPYWFAMGAVDCGCTYCHARAHALPCLSPRSYTYLKKKTNPKRVHSMTLSMGRNVPAPAPHLHLHLRPNGIQMCGTVRTHGRGHELLRQAIGQSATLTTSEGFKKEEGSTRAPPRARGTATRSAQEHSCRHTTQARPEVHRTRLPGTAGAYRSVSRGDGPVCLQLVLSCLSAAACTSVTWDRSKTSR